MDDIAKFISDVEKTIKHDRQNNGGKSDYSRFKKDIKNLFIRNTSSCGELPGSIYDYWENQYVYNSANVAEEPVRENIERLGAFLGFLHNSRDDEDLLVQEDWDELGRLVGYEAEDLPIDVLQDLMKIVVDHGAY